MEELRLMMLESNTASKVWDSLYAALSEALPKLDKVENEKRKRYLQTAILRKLLTVWTAVKLDGNVVMVGATIPQVDMYSGTMGLLVYAVQSFDNDLATWEFLYKKLSKYCKDNNLDKIMFYSTNESVTKLAQALGGHIIPYIELEVANE